MSVFLYIYKPTYHWMDKEVKTPVCLEYLPHHHHHPAESKNQHLKGLRVEIQD